MRPGPRSFDAHRTVDAHCRSVADTSILSLDLVSRAQIKIALLPTAQIIGRTNKEAPRRH